MEADARTQQVISASTVDSVNKRTLSPKDVYRNDPWMVFFRDRLSLNNWLSLGIVVLLSICCFYGLYILPGTGHGLANQPLFALLETITASLFYVAYLWLPETIAVLFNTLGDNTVLDQSEKSPDASAAYAEFIEKLLSLMNSMGWFVGCLVFIVAYLINRYLVNGPPFLTYVPLWLQFVTAVLDGVIAYYAFISVTRLLISLFYLNRLFHIFKIHVKPLHPDGVGGLGAIRSMVWISVLLILAITLTFFETILISKNRNPISSTLDIIVLIVAYVILTPSLILGWLTMPHLVMLKRRDEALKPLVDEFQAILESPQLLSPEDTPAILADTDRLSAIKRRYSLIIETFPTWPLEVTQLRRVVAALSLPALISAIPPIYDLITFVIQQVSKK